MNLVGYVIKSCEAWKPSQNIWSPTNQVHIPVNFLTLFITYINFMFEKGKPFNITSKLYLLIVFYIYNNANVRQ